MPKLDWIGKQYVVNHVSDVPFRLLEKVPESSLGQDSGNMVLHGDNLEALLPSYRQQVKRFAEDAEANLGDELELDQSEIERIILRIVGGGPTETRSLELPPKEPDLRPSPLPSSRVM
jgi:hypothetical protein